VSTSIEELTRLAKQYIEAHKEAPSVFSRGTPLLKQGQLDKRSIPETSGKVTENSYSPVKSCFICNRQVNNRSQAPKVFFICIKMGHIVKYFRQTKSEGVRNDRKVTAVCAKTDLNPQEKNNEDGILALAGWETVPIFAGA
jgi:hypothetical protein